MDGYEEMSLTLQNLLLKDGRSTEDVARIMDTFCIVANEYNIEKACKDIIVYDGIPRVVDEYLACRLMEGISQNTIKNYKDVLYSFFKFISFCTQFLIS